MKQKSIRVAGKILAALVLNVGSIGVFGQTAKVDVTGVWVFNVESAAGVSAPTVTFTQEGEKLTGHYSSQLVGEAELTGTVKGQAIEFIVVAEVLGARFELRYSGTVDSKDSMKGKLSMGELGDGTFTGKRK